MNALREFYFAQKHALNFISNQEINKAIIKRTKTASVAKRKISVYFEIFIVVNFKEFHGTACNFCCRFVLLIAYIVPKKIFDSFFVEKKTFLDRFLPRLIKINKSQRKFMT